MYRRRRRTQEIGFSFDSFLDVVANVVGIILRLILVVWVSARSYSSLHTIPPSAPDKPSAEPTKEVSDPLQIELAQRRRELAEVQARLLEQLRHLEQAEQGQAQAAGKLADAVARREQLDRDRSQLTQTTHRHEREQQDAALSLAQLQERSRQLGEAIRAIEQLPPAKQVLRYQTPVSRPIHSDELLFECRQGRVAFIDIAALLQDVRPRLDDSSKQLRTQWQVSDVVGPVGAFQLRYTVERERGPIDGALGGDSPTSGTGFRYGLSSWEIEPVTLVHGEDEATALTASSEFRQIADRLDPQQVTVTFWVYPDSFPLYRRLRDYLYERDVVVAGRPLPEGVPIASSRRGTVSRGQ
jgi:hypothetical protein